MNGKRDVAMTVVLIGSVLAGCGAKQRSTMEPTVEQGEPMSDPVTAENGSERLAGAIDSFAAARKGLVGHSDEQSRQQLADALGKLSDVLTLLKGPDANGAFRQQIRIIERARTQLTSGSPTAPEPTINAAMRSAQRALSDIASTQFSRDEQTQALIDALDPRIDVLSNERGPLHDFETARALDALGAAVERMAEVVQQRTPKEQPATAPASADAE